MGFLKSGDVVEAIVLGFLPGRKVILDVRGRALIAWSDLPLVRGEAITAVVEADEDRPRLRVVEEAEGRRGHSLSDVLGMRGIPTDDLDLCIARTATGLHLPLEDRLFRDVRRYLGNREKGLDAGVVPLRKLRKMIFKFLAARARSLPPSPRVLRAVESSHETRLGIALLRLIESLKALSQTVGSRSRKTIADRALLLRSFFVDLGVSASETDLGAALSRCGYEYESKLAARGFSDWDVDASREEHDMKGALLSLWFWLRDRERDGSLVRRNQPGRRSLERSLAWCGQALDIIEAIQVQNLPCSRDSRRTAGFQLPILWGNEAGTLFLLVSETMSQFWLELPGGKCVAGEFSTRKRRTDLGLHLSEWNENERSAVGKEWFDAVTRRVHDRFEHVTVRPIRTPPRISLDSQESEARARHVDLKL